MIFKKRIPEFQEEMDDEKEVLKYFMAHQKLKKSSWDIYDVISRYIIKNTHIKEGKCLDVGCGYGGLINSMSKYLKKIEFFGIDLSKTMINFAKKKFPDEKTTFLLMSADKLAFNDETFDLIICKDLFHHLKNPIKALKEMYRVLKKGGQIYVIDLMRDVPEDVFYRTVQGASQLNLENAILYTLSINASYTLKEMDTLIKKAGINKYRLFISKVNVNFLKECNLKSKDYHLVLDYLNNKLILIVDKQ